MSKIDMPPPKPDSVGSLNDAISPGKHPAAVALGRLGGLKGGKARAARLSPEERQRIARDAAAARWRNKE